MSNTSHQSYTLTVARVEAPTTNSKAIFFEKHSLPSALAGQFLTVVVTPHNTELRRAYSLFTTPDEDWGIGVKRVAGGIVSNYLNTQARKGMKLQVLAPTGQFTYNPAKDLYEHLLLIGGGSGITPLLSILQTALIKTNKTKITLLYVNRCKADTMFKHTIDELANQYRDRFTAIHYLNTEHQQTVSQPKLGFLGKLGLKKTSQSQGLITKENIIDYLRDFPLGDSTGVFICGPKGLMDLAETTVRALGQPSKNIKRENFVASNTAPKTPDFTPPDCEATVTLQGVRHRFTIPSGKSVLQAAVEAEVDIPYICREGSCTACYGRCTSGDVKLLTEESLSDEEITEGGFLPCVGYPTSKKIEFTID